MGYAGGLWAGSVYPLGGRRFVRLPFVGQAAVLSAAAMLVGNLPATTMAITDPRDWSASDWLTDVNPHVGYALITIAAYRLIRRRLSGDPIPRMRR